MKILRFTAFFFFFVVISSSATFAQENLQNTTKNPESDTIPVNVLQEVIVNTTLRDSIQYLPEVKGVYVFAGKKTNIVIPNSAQANLAQSNVRQIFAKVPGVTTWDMDGAGTQLNIGSRGVDSHRSIEMNMRQNGYVTNSDIFGYPENHYTLPLEAVQEIQYVRGSAALQYGSQYGGMLNFIIKQGDSTKPIAVESNQTAGSNGFFNSYNAVGGTVGKINYYAYYDNRHGNGWRPSQAFDYQAYYANIEYRFNNNGSIALQFSRMNYVQQIAGGLTDAQFDQNPRQSLRNRNFFNPEINIPALIFKYAFSPNTKLQVTTNALFGQRNSVQYINTPNIPDTVNLQLGTYNPRQVDRDYYSSFNTEARLLHAYKIGKTTNSLAAGFRWSSEVTRRDQLGVGTTGSNFDLSLVAPYGTVLRFHTNNAAVFAENVFQITPKFSITPGFRYELIQSDYTGLISHATVPVAYNGNRSFPLFGTGLQYQLTKSTQLYGNISQEYRPYLYSQITPADRVDIIDPNLKDSKGYDISVGYRGNIKNILQFDVDVFRVFFGNRVGLITQKDANNNPYLFTTNIGNAVAKGVEAYGEVSLVALFNGNNKLKDVRLFNSLAYTHAQYTSGELNANGNNINLIGNYVEHVPQWVDRAGLTLLFRQFTTTLQFSYTDKSYNDALNTITSANGVTGVIPSYALWDWSMGYAFSKKYRITGGINNLMNLNYFSQRITFYPGPGILPADGRTFYVSFSVKM